MEQVTCNGFQSREHGFRRWLRSRAIAPSLICFLALSYSFPSPAADESLEYQVKAAFLLNFTKFVEWPPSAFDAAHSPIAICILGEDPFGAALDQIVAGEIVSGRKLLVRRLKRPPEPKECQAVFVGGADEVRGSTPGMLPGNLGPGILTVGEGENFIHDGGMIAFVLENRRVRFSINQSAAENAGLKLSSKLLNVAKPVQQPVEKK
jgi:hypothetical protein